MTTRGPEGSSSTEGSPRPSDSSDGTEASASPNRKERDAMDLVNEVPAHRLMELVVQSTRR